MLLDHQMTWKYFCNISHSNCILFTPQYWNCTLASHTFPVYNQTIFHHFLFPVVIVDIVVIESWMCINIPVGVNGCSSNSTSSHICFTNKSKIEAPRTSCVFYNVIQPKASNLLCQQMLRQLMQMTVLRV